MAAGLQCFDASGNLVVDITSRLSRIVGSTSITANASGSVSVPVAGTIWYAFQPNRIWGFVNMDTPRPNFSISGSTLSWTFSAAFSNNSLPVIGTVFYGVY